MAYIWAVLAAIQPAFQTVTDASDPAIRMLMKTPASLADLGVAALVAWALRDRPRWAVLGALAVLLVPAVPYVSAWWGQYESIFVWSGLGGALAAARGRNGLAAVLVAVSLCTKPQALPFVLPFAAWFWATGYARDGVRGGVLELVRTGLAGLATLVVLWLPFIPNGGPGDYLSNLAYYQNEIFSTLSLRAWNAWSLVQDLAVGGQFVVDDVPLIGPITMRHIGYAVTGLLSLTISLAIVRDPRPRTLILGLSASVLAFFCFMTQMHERYAYAAVILLILLLPERRVAWSWVALATVFSLNLIAAIPPDLEPGSLIPVTGIVGIIGALAMIAIFVVTLRLVRAGPGHPGDGSV